MSNKEPREKSASGPDAVEESPTLVRSQASLSPDPARELDFLGEAPTQVRSHASPQPSRVLSDAPAPSAAPISPTPGRTLAGRYTVLNPLGRGGMGEVVAAYDSRLDRRVALKLLRRELDSSQSQRDLEARMLREAQAMARLSHPNVVAIYDVGTLEDGAIFIAMEMVEGQTLRRWLEQAPRTWREVLATYLDAARGLAAAHAAGLVHRDFKPENVLVGTDGRVRVMDFGLARAESTPAPGASVDLSQALKPGPWRAPSPSMTRCWARPATWPPRYCGPESRMRAATCSPSAWPSTRPSTGSIPSRAPPTPSPARTSTRPG